MSSWYFWFSGSATASPLSHAMLTCRWCAGLQLAVRAWHGRRRRRRTGAVRTALVARANRRAVGPATRVGVAHVGATAIARALVVPRRPADVIPRFWVGSVAWDAGAWVARNRPRHEEQDHKGRPHRVLLGVLRSETRFSNRCLFFQKSFYNGSFIMGSCMGSLVCGVAFGR